MFDNYLYFKYNFFKLIIYQFKYLLNLKNNFTNLNNYVNLFIIKYFILHFVLIHLFFVF
jgi:hypothetical protein